MQVTNTQISYTHSIPFELFGGTLLQCNAPLASIMLLDSIITQPPPRLTTLKLSTKGSYNQIPKERLHDHVGLAFLGENW